MKSLLALLFATATILLLPACVTESTTKSVVMTGDAGTRIESSDTHRLSPEPPR